jgi:diacylglycerol kinase (ATP)
VSGIGLVFNPRAGRNKRDPGAPLRLARQLGDHGVVVAPRSLDELFRAAEDFRRQKIDVLGIAGGDGTNHVTLTGFHQVYEATPLPTVALLRGGTMNTVANALRLPRGRTEGLLDSLVRRYLETPTLPSVEQWTMDIEGKLGFLWGLGVIPAYLREYYGTGEPSPATAVKTLARAIGSAFVHGRLIQRMTEPVHVAVETEGGHWPMRPYFSVAAGTIVDIGLGFKPFYRVASERGKLHLLGIHTSPISFIADLPRIHRAEPMRPGKCTDALVTEARLHTEDGKFVYTIDGDVIEHHASEMTLKIGPSVRIATMS